MKFIQSLSQLQNDPISFLNTLIQHKINNIWTCIVCEIVSYDLKARTVSVQPLIKEVFVTESNTSELIELPVLEDVPLIYLYGGVFEMTFPIKEKDECLVFFSKQCIDNWWQKGGTQPPFELRHFDPSDGFALVGVFSQKMIQSNTLLEPIEDGMCIRQIDDTISLSITEENLTFYTKADDKTKNELILDKEGNYTYNIYNGDDLVSEDTIDSEGVHTLNIYDGSDVSNSLIIDKETVTFALKESKVKVDVAEDEVALNMDDKMKLNLSTSEVALNINDKMQLNLSESEVALDINNKMSITASESSLEVSANNQATVTIEGSTVSVELGQNKIEVSSSGIVLDNGTCKVEVGASGVNINGGALSVMP